MLSTTFKTAILLGTLTALLVLFGGAFGGRDGMVIAFVFALLMNAASFWFSDKIVLAMYRAKPLAEAEAPAVHRMVRELAQRAGMPMPRLYRIPTATPNAFATGRNPRHAVVAVTEGILRLMDEEELEGVLAHELSHVRNRDILISTIAATLAGAVMMLAHMARWAAFFGSHRGGSRGGGNPFALIFMAVLAPIAALLIQMAVSRAREFQADASGAQLTKKPWGLARALEKLHQASQRLPMEANPATAHLFIVNPLSGRSMLSWFSTHPPVEERVARLGRMRV